MTSTTAPSQPAAPPDASEASSAALAAHRERLDAHVREIVAWHFSPATGTPYWIDYARERGLDPVNSIQTFDDLIQTFDHFPDDALRFEPHERFIPKHFEGRPYNVFETGGTTGMPKQRINWEDFQYDYEWFSTTLLDEHFPPGGNWLMIGPTGPRRLRLAIEHLAHHRGSSCYFVDLDPRFVKKIISAGQPQTARMYMDHVIDQALILIRHREITALFTTPKLLEALAEKISLRTVGIKGAFVGGTTMTPQYTRFLVEEVCENRDGKGIGFYPTYGNTLMGVAPHKHTLKEDNYSITYYPPQPRAVVRIVNPDETAQTVDYDAFGRVELTTLTKELFLPRFLERDEAKRCHPIAQYPWDGVGEVRPFSKHKSAIVEGVY